MFKTLWILTSWTLWLYLIFIFTLPSKVFIFKLSLIFAFHVLFVLVFLCIILIHLTCLWCLMMTCHANTERALGSLWVNWKGLKQKVLVIWKSKLPEISF
jgi:hypothetical protein